MMSQIPKTGKTIKAAKTTKKATKTNKAVKITPAKKALPSKKQIFSLPDREDMLAFIELNGLELAEDLTFDALDMIFDAYDASTKRSAVALAKKALMVSPLCADAYSFLAVNQATPEAAWKYYQRAVEAGEIVLGPNARQEYGDHYWGFIETRPYMRALGGVCKLSYAYKSGSEIDKREECFGQFVISG